MNTIEKLRTFRNQIEPRINVFSKLFFSAYVIYISETTVDLLDIIFRKIVTPNQKSRTDGKHITLYHKIKT